MAPNIASISPSWSKTKMADVPGFIRVFTSLTKSSPIPAEAKTAAVPAPPLLVAPGVISFSVTSAPLPAASIAALGYAQ